MKRYDTDNVSSILFEKNDKFNFIVDGSNTEIHDTVKLDNISETAESGDKRVDIFLSTDRKENLIGDLKKTKHIVSIKQITFSSNILAVSIIIRDSNRSMILSKRSNNCEVGAGLNSVAATGMVLTCDLHGTNPILNAAYRILKDELPVVNISSYQLEFAGIAVGLKNRQPVALVNVLLNRRFGLGLINALNNEKKDKIEEYFIQDLWNFDEKEVEKINLFKENMTEVGSFHIFCGS